MPTAEEMTREMRERLFALFPTELRTLAEAYAAISVAEFAMRQHSVVATAWEGAVARAQGMAALALNGEPRAKA